MAIRTGRRSFYVPTDSQSALHRLLLIHGDDQVSAVLEDAAQRYLTVIEHSLPDFSVAEWCMVVDSLLGIWVSDEFQVTLLGETILEGMGMDELDQKWDVDGGRMREILTELSYAGQQAVAEMVELFRKKIKIFPALTPTRYPASWRYCADTNPMLLMVASSGGPRTAWASSAADRPSAERLKLAGECCQGRR